METKLTTAQIGAAGELLVQFELMLKGIVTACPAVDDGVDLHCYNRGTRQAVTVQVKTIERPVKSGGRYAGANRVCVWNVHIENDADVIALVCLSTRDIWLFTKAEYARAAQQRPASGNLRFGFYVEPNSRGTADRNRALYDSHLLKNAVERLFPATVLAAPSERASVLTKSAAATCTPGAAIRSESVEVSTLDCGKEKL